MIKFLLTFFAAAFSCSAIAQADHVQVINVNSELAKLNIDHGDIYITDYYQSRDIVHTYFKESINGIPIYNSRGSMHSAKGLDPYVTTSFKDIQNNNLNQISPILSAFEAIEQVMKYKGLTSENGLTLVDGPNGQERHQTFEDENISLMPIAAKLQFLVVENGDIRLAWEFAIEETESAWMTDYFVDAHKGMILLEEHWTVECNHGANSIHKHEECQSNHREIPNLRSFSMVPNTYEVYEWPVESPNFGSRTIVTSPWNDNIVASPDGWHTIEDSDFTTTRGNNTDTYLDNNNSNSPTGGDAARADGGSDLEFIFPLDVNGNPVDFREAAITNTFYWTNLMHDVWFNYGFDEESGNFQEFNFTNDGVGSDYVRAEVQDGSGTCNANFGTPGDGGNPRMQMFLCNGRDGDFDNGVIAHEYGHGISNRLTGGPSASGCLGNQEQMGEGWSDYVGMVMTIESGDQESDARSVGTWLFGQGPNGGGIRPFPYSTDRAVNPMTYASSFSGVSVPHGVGSVWCTMLWDLTWALIDEYGFDPDIYNGTGGNNIAMELVLEGMKLQPCRPGFVDGRDAILEADLLLNGGVNEKLIWKAFAERGLGYNADQGDSENRGDGQEGFELPLEIEKIGNVSTAEEGDQIQYDIIVTSKYKTASFIDLVITDSIPDELIFVSASDNGSFSNGVITFPTFTLAAENSVTFQVVLEVKQGLDYAISDFYDDQENGTANWSTAQSGSISWANQSGTAFSGTNSWFVNDAPSTGEAFLDFDVEVGLGAESELAFYHQYNTEAAWDGGRVYISSDNGISWINLGSRMTKNGYNSTIFNNSNSPGFSGNSNGFILTVVDLSDFAGSQIRIRFQMNCDQAVGSEGWYLDDVMVSDVRLTAINRVAANSAELSMLRYANPIELLQDPSEFSIIVEKENITCNNLGDGFINLFPNGGSGNYDYDWNDGVTQQNRNPLSEGIYTVTVSDGQTDLVKSRVVINPDVLTLSLFATRISNANMDNGSVVASSQGGTEPITYLWSTGATTNSITDLVESTYSLTITDEKGCEIEDEIEVTPYKCGEKYFDSGQGNGNYSNQEDITTVICPDQPNEPLTVTFNSFSVEFGWDALYIHNGNSINDPLFSSGNGATQAGFPAGGYYGTNLPGTFTSTDPSGCITFRFRSDQFVTGAGWDVDLLCCSTILSSTLDSGSGSLREAIECLTNGGEVIVDPLIFGESVEVLSPITINRSISINPGVGNSFDLKATQATSLFQVGNSGILDLDNVILLSGTNDIGGAILNSGQVRLNTVEVYKNENLPNQSSTISNNGVLRISGNTKILKE